MNACFSYVRKSHGRTYPLLLLFYWAEAVCFSPFFHRKRLEIKHREERESKDEEVFN